MKEKMETWQILHIPANPQLPPHQQPTVNAFASIIEPKLANTILRRLNQIAPFENLHHVKRIQKRQVEGGNTQLSLIICLAPEDNKLSSLPQDLQQLIDSYHLSPYITKICKYAATSQEEWVEQCKLWPTSFHPPTYNIDGITGFSEEDSHSIFSFMKMALELAKSVDGSIVNAAVIVDPSVKQIITTGYDQLYSWHSPLRKTCVCLGFQEQPAGRICCANCNGVSDQRTLLSDGSLNESEFSSINISCLNPWQWPELQLDRSTAGYWHPLRHAAIVAIDASADRDRDLFPVSGNEGEKLSEVGKMQSSSVNFPAKRQKTDLANVDVASKLDANTEGSHFVGVRPYLCTGYDIYLVWEPCIMCAMALVHQRIRRIFYAFPNPNAGALGSVHRLQGEKSLNHHYAVFRVILPEDDKYRIAVARGTNNSDNSALLSKNGHSS